MIVAIILKNVVVIKIVLIIVKIVSNVPKIDDIIFKNCDNF